MRLFRLLLVLGLLGAAGAAPATDMQDPQTLVKDVTDQVLARLDKERAQLKADPQRIYPLVEDLVLPHFDFTRMSAWVLGRNWRIASADQRSQFTEQFRTLLVRTYAVALLEYSGQTVNFLPSRLAEDGRSALVRTEIAQTGQASIALNYSLYQRNGQWLVYDISVDGVSLVTNYRSSFATEIAQGGIDGLIAQLEKRNAQSGAGSQ